MQGYYFSKPLTVEAFAALVRERRGRVETQPPEWGSATGKKTG